MTTRLASMREFPDRCDFAVICVNSDEDAAVRNILTPNKPTRGSGHSYYWGTVKTNDQGEAFVISNWTGDKKGPKNAESLTRNLIEMFDPQYILVLGTAGGFKSRDRSYGQVVFSRLVRSSQSRGHMTRMEIVEEGNIPPESELILLADHVVRTKKWLSILSTRRIKPPRRGADHSKVQRADMVEFFSAPDRIDNPDSDLCKAVLCTFPNVAAVEMEGAGVATATLDSVRQGRQVGYIVIKGISDLIDDKGLKTPVERKKIRRMWAPYASAASASFARALIEAWPSKGKRRLASTILPNKYRDPLTNINHVANTRCTVLHRIHPEEYSRLSTLYTNLPDTIGIFTVCAYEPRYFVDQIQQAQQHGAGYSINKKHFLKLADSIFPHFEAFRSFCKPGHEIVRILLVKDSYDKWLEANKEYLPSFNWLNGKVKCYISEASELRQENVSHLTDHVVFNSELWLDYNEQSHTLLLTFERSGNIQTEFTRIETHFQQKSTTRLYKPLGALLIALTKQNPKT